MKFPADSTSAAPDRCTVEAGWSVPLPTVIAQFAEGLAYWDALQYVGRWTRENHALIHEALSRRLDQRALAGAPGLDIRSFCGTPGLGAGPSAG